MLSSEKQALLRSFLGQLPDDIAARLAKAVEVDRLIGGTQLPHDVILDGLRPKLRQSLKTVRTPTPLRQFCLPFEDLLVSGQRMAKLQGRIARSSIEPVWNWLAKDLMPQAHAALTQAIREAVLDGRMEDVKFKVAELQAAAAAALKGALDNPKTRTAVARRLGGEIVVADAMEMALLLSVAPEIGALQKKLPRPIVELSEDDIGALRDAYDHFSEAEPDLAPYVALIVMGRLERPWEALRLAAIVSHHSTDTLISNTDLGVVGELLFADLENYMRAIRVKRGAEFDERALVDNIGAFAELSSGMVKELGIRREGKWGQRLTRSRSAVAEVMDAMMERAPKEIFAALPIHKVGGFGGKSPRRLDLGRPPDAEKVARARRYAYVMVHCRPFAAAAAFAATLNAAMDETVAALRLYGEDIVREVRAATLELQANAEQHFTVALDLCTLILGEQEADLLRRRSRVVVNA